MEQLIGTGNGANAGQVLANEAANAGAPTAVHSAPSPKTSKRSTTARDEKLSDQDLLDILENTLDRMGRRWEPARFTKTQSGRPAIILPVPIEVCQYCKHLRLASAFEGDRCAKCNETGV